MRVITNPTIEEIAEFIDIARRAHDIDEVVRQAQGLPNGVALAEYLFNGWTYLFYSDDLVPLCLFNFTFFQGQSRALEHCPWVNLLSTGHCRPWHLHAVFLCLTRMGVRHFKGAKARIVRADVQSLAGRLGWVRQRPNEYYVSREAALRFLRGRAT